MLKRLTLLVVCLMLPTLVLAVPFHAGKDYKVVNTPQLKWPTTRVFNTQFKGQHNKVVVTEFFSYGCPACFHFERSLEKWLKTKPKDVSFRRIPVVFNPRWLILAKAYYTAEKLGVVEKITPLMFDAVQVKGINLTNEQQIQEMFAKVGVSATAFRNAFNFAPELAAQLIRGQTLMRVFKIYAIPTVVIDGKYLVNPGMSGGGPEKVIHVMNYLIKKSRVEEKTLVEHTPSQ